MSDPSIVRVALGARSYDVEIGAGLIARAGERVRRLAKRAAVVTDAHVAALHLAPLMQSLAGAGVAADAIVLPPGEAQKSFAGLQDVCGRLIDLGVERTDVIVALGGGVIGDLAGFAAGVLKRGVDFVQIPTTLLAQVDSSVGGKTAIDTPQGKNLVGLFHQPRAVIADLDTLATLPARQMRAGYAEIVKYGLIDDADFFGWCEANGPHVLAHDRAALAHAVRVSVEAKARIVAADEREAGVRALLNLGHTFAHALEASAGYDETLLHGEAVGAGLALAFRFSAQLGLCSTDDARRVSAHLESAGLVSDIRALAGGPYAPSRLIEAMLHDKKAEGGQMTLILAQGIGRAFVQKDAPVAAVRALLDAETAIAA
ncbi:MAG: 3-dehydroquinate synthase [Alphaproteobacteria bacterium]|nr:3-dehydroquinate synthase [Alphaproteobacteria bacterium]